MRVYHYRAGFTGFLSRAGGLFAVLTACAVLCLGAVRATAQTPINCIGVENEYANVIEQIGGKYVTVSSIESDPNTDPHVFQASPSVAAQVAQAQVIVRNGLGYDDWIETILAAAPNAQRQVIDVQTLLGLPDSTPNPHLWYKPITMPNVARAVANALSTLDPAHKQYYFQNVTNFDASLIPWYLAIAEFNDQYGGTPVAVTEPVGDYMLEATGCVIQTPWNLQAAIMNGTDPSPQDVSVQNQLLSGQVKVFVYNQQVTDSLTQSFLQLAAKSNTPVVGVYETMPTGYTYQQWMLAEVQAMSLAVKDGTSTTVLK
ncbi:MAG TPA: zinc ABC transporter substrate-binding protein [Phycisphaerae bacterium]|nr:zinc ABC transporter substrate-binding protein [Phycisphaerae bacterium]